MPLRESTKETIAAITHMLKAGKSPKEIAFRLQVTISAVKMVIHRHTEARKTFIDTHPLRYPEAKGPPDKIIQPLLKQIVT